VCRVGGRDGIPRSTLEAWSSADTQLGRPSAGDWCDARARRGERARIAGGQVPLRRPRARPGSSAHLGAAPGRLRAIVAGREDARPKGGRDALRLARPLHRRHDGAGSCAPGASSTSRCRGDHGRGSPRSGPPPVNKPHPPTLDRLDGDGEGVLLTCRCAGLRHGAPTAGVALRQCPESTSRDCLKQRSSG